LLLARPLAALTLRLQGEDSTQFTWFTSIKVRILTQKLLARALAALTRRLPQLLRRYLYFCTSKASKASKLVVRVKQVKQAGLKKLLVRSRCVCRAWLRQFLYSCTSEASKSSSKSSAPPPPSQHTDASFAPPALSLGLLHSSSMCTFVLVKQVKQVPPPPPTTPTSLLRRPHSLLY
jgi:hypothetical protein